MRVCGCEQDSMLQSQSQAGVGSVFYSVSCVIFKLVWGDIEFWLIDLRESFVSRSLLYYKMWELEFVWFQVVMYKAQ